MRILFRIMANNSHNTSNKFRPERVVWEVMKIYENKNQKINFEIMLINVQSPTYKAVLVELFKFNWRMKWLLIVKVDNERKCKKVSKFLVEFKTKKFNWN